MDSAIDRPDLSELTSEQIAPLEAHFTSAWSDVWCDLARSLYVTLVSQPEPMPLEGCAKLAAALTLGIAQDMGGVQYYIQAGTALLQSLNAQRVMQLLARGDSYRAVAVACGLTEPSVRRIERAFRKAQIDQAKEEFERAQSALAF